MANQFVDVAKVWSAYEIWRRTGSRAMGAVLIAGLDSPHEDVATIAGILLSREGNAKRAIPLLLKAIDEGRSMPHALVVLSSQDFENRAQYDMAVRVIERFEHDSNPQIAREAQLILRDMGERGLD